jgi:hypothetical protein
LRGSRNVGQILPPVYLGYRYNDIVSDRGFYPHFNLQ